MDDDLGEAEFHVLASSVVPRAYGLVRRRRSARQPRTIAAAELSGDPLNSGGGWRVSGSDPILLKQVRT
ncbi:hypothetical protein [Streptomyces albicerus]|uniref:hypothetical protein n=1 Tax=Streptomyces albicerus TaxID=2569859 RepID=UPI00124B0C6F|nr:hypothetical protein [Streptomyces albicerus]